MVLKLNSSFEKPIGFLGFIHRGWRGHDVVKLLACVLDRGEIFDLREREVRL